MLLQKIPTTAAVFLAALISTIATQAQESVREVLTDRSINWEKPTGRALAVQRLKTAEDRQLAKATAIALKLGKPLREKLPDGRLRVLAGIDDDGELLYNEDRNVNAAISTAANKLHTIPFSVDGSGVRVGVWENNSPRDTHVEFNDGTSSRINRVDSVAYGYHATHVAGIIAAFGVDPSAKGMAYQTIVDAYTASNDGSEMTGAAATGTGQHANKIYVSNHSYGFTYGWKYVGDVLTWTGTGTDQNAYDPDFGQYSTTSAYFDTIHYNSPYYLAFWAAGNENTDGPSNNQSVSIGGSMVNYNASIHPQNDGTYSGGFDTLGDHTTAKNVMVIGAVNDAVTSGQRDPSKATKASWSSTGPCDDGRIKPDVVGNGVGLRSTDFDNDTDYVSLSGTSMASPNVCGTAALLVDMYRDRFSGGAMRGSTLRSLLIHTATDIGNPGPDYSYGWGLVDAEKAAELIQRQADYPSLESIIEDQLSTAQTLKNHTFFWDGVSPIRATLCWTDPAGSAESTHNDRTPDLVNDLNLKLIAPDGTTEYFPFVMPFVGTWTIASMSQNATTGVNHVDNVEQVLINNPGQSGEWTIEVTYAGSLTNNTQEYGLIVSGSDTTPAGLIAFPNNGSFSISEDGASATITVDRVNGTIGEVSVDYATSDGSATVGSDYSSASGTLSWADGDGTSKTFTVPILDDSVDEISVESVIITLSNPSGTTINGANQATLSIHDDDNVAPVVSAGLDDTIYLAEDAWTPTQISTSAWYDAADTATITATSGAVSQWNDKSGNGHHATQATGGDQPVSGSRTLNGKNVIDFVSNDFLKSLGAISAQPISYAIVGELDAAGESNTLMDANGSSRCLVRRRSTNDIGMYAASWLVDDRSTIGSGSVLVGGVFNGASSELHYYGGTAVTGDPGSGDFSEGITIGNNNAPNAGYAHNGTIGEIVIYSGIWDTATRQKIEGYLAWKWGLEAGLPMGHPYKSGQLVATANLDGNVTDSTADLTVMNTLWTLVSGPDGATVVFGDATAIDTTATFTQPGIYTLRLTADDGDSQISADVVITVNEAGISLVIDQAAISENGGTSNATLTRQETVGDLVVTLSSSDETEATVPSSVTIPDGQSTATFTVTAQNDAILDGTQTVTITATANGVPTRTATIEITDSESTVTYDGNGSKAGTPPVDLNAYEEGASVTVLGKNTLSNEPYLFNGWNTVADGSGTTYAQGSTYTINADTTLYAMWVPGPVALYEPFDDLDSTLTGNTPGFGLSGTWSGSALVAASSLSYGSLPTSGGRVVANAGTSFPNGYISPGTTLSDAGLMADGATLWFSVLIVNHADVAGSGTTDNRTYVSFGTGAPDGFDRIGGNSGSGFTIAVSKVSEYGITAQAWNDGSNATGGATRGSTVIGTAGSTFLAVGKITWGEFGVTDDVFELYLPGTDLAKPGSPISTVAADFDQLGTTATWSTAETNLFDTIGFVGARSPNNVPEVDELRFGSTYEGVVGQSSTSLSVTYNGNGNDAGAAPTDASSPYNDGALVTVLDNTGGLTKSGYTFAGWNTASDGSGISYVANDAFTITGDVILYAQWDTLYSDWAGTNGLTGDDALPGAVLQPDGFANLQKFAFGMDPVVAYFDPLEFVVGGELTAPGAPTLLNMAAPGQADDERAVFSRLKNYVDAGLTYTVEFSADLKAWTASATPPTVLTDENSSQDHEVVSVPFPLSVPVQDGGALPPKFLRIVVSNQ